MKPCAAVVPWLGEGDRHHGRGVPTGHRRRVRAVRSARHPGGVHPPGVRQPPDPELAARRCPTSRRSSMPATPVRIAEVGCGEGLAAITIARAYPNAEVDGYDLDDASIAAAQQAAVGRRRGRPGPVRGARRRRPDDRGRLRPRHGDRDAPRRARPGRDPADDADASPATRARCSWSTNGPRTPSRCRPTRWSGSSTRSARCTAWR